MEWNRLLEHIYLVGMSLGFTVVIGLALGVLAYMKPRLAGVILQAVDILQTIPSLATLGIIMILFGGNKVTVIVGIVLYSLLPIVRNTYTGLKNISPAVKEAARGMGMTRAYRLVHVEFPCAFPVIFTGIRISAVTSIGVAVFGTFVGGGGLGSVLYRAILIQNMRMLALGTLSLMVMAVAVDSVMGMIEKRLYCRRHL